MTLAAASPTVRVRAPGKLNVFFAVGAAGEDGYHDVASVYQAVSLYEDVSASDSDDFTLAVSGDVDVESVPLDASNLAIRAARLLAEHTGYRGGVHLGIHKSVPVAGGMGGGSADAAGALLACDTLWQTGLSHTELHTLAAQLGADVPFALLGGTAVGVGRGDRLTPALARGRFDWVLVLADEGLSTPRVYGVLDDLRAQVEVGPAPANPTVPAPVLHALRAGDPAALARATWNDLQSAAFHVRPELSDIVEVGRAHGALTGLVSGSGPTVALLAPSTTAATSLHGDLTALGHRAILAHGPVSGAKVIA